MTAWLIVSWIAAFPAAGPRQAETKAWYESYEEALVLVEAGRYAEATERLKEAIAARPIPQVRARTYGLRYVDYLPYLFLGICAQQMGKEELAREYFDLSERHRAVLESEEGRALLEKHRERLGARGPEAAAAGRVAEQEEVETPAGLSEQEYRRIEQEVLDRCRLDRSTASHLQPWYFHYELGQELLGKDDPSRALNSFLDALERKEKPQRFSRSYGMWYLNYAPYYQIGQAHYQLGNYDCAAEAFEASLGFNELTPQDEEYEVRRRLLQQAKEKTRSQK